MLNIKSLISVALAAIVFITGLSSCERASGDLTSSETSSTPSGKSEPSVTLMYDGDSLFDPFKSSGTYDHQLFPLVFPGLFEVQADGSFECKLAKEYEITGKSAVITLADVCFSDGSKVTAADVVTSYGYAKKSARYGKRFEKISSVKANGEKVVITFTDHAEYNLCLFDIPIVKRSGDRTLGAGEYRFETADGADMLVYNGTDGKKLSNISLYPIGDATSAVYAFNKKSVSALSLDNSKNGIVFKGNYEILPFATDYFIFIGFNTKNALFANADIRKAFNIVFDRSALEEGENAEYAEFVWQPVSKEYGALAAFGLPSSVYMPDLAEEIFESYGIKEKNGKYQTGELTLIVNNEDALKMSLADNTASLLAKHGITVKVKKLGFEAFNAALAAGEFDLYLAETLMPQNMDVTVLGGASLNFSGANFKSFSAIYEALASGDAASTAFDTFLDESPIMPVCYRKACLVYSRIFTSSPSPSRFSVYSGLLDM